MQRNGFSLRIILVLLTVFAVLGPPGAAAPKAKTKILLIGHKHDHPPGTHMYLEVCDLLARSLRQTPGVEAIVSDGWPKDPKALAGVTAIVLYTSPGGNIVLDPAHREQAERLLKDGVGLTAIHWATDAREELGPAWQSLLGGWFNSSLFSKLATTTATLRQADPKHPISRGWSGYDLRDEFYLNLRFAPQSKPLVTANVNGQEQVVAWTYVRPVSKNGRSFGTVLGHFYENFQNASFRRFLVNGILWTARRDIPKNGAPLPPLGEWTTTGGDPGRTRYSPLGQIHTGNVQNLTVAWTYRTGDAGSGSSTTIECTPLMAEGLLYLTSASPRPKVIALDAATGRERWKFDPYDGFRAEHPIASGGVNRGVAYWSDGRENGARRIFHGAADGRLIALDARTGRPEPRFGENGVVDLRRGMERDLSKLPYGPTSPPAVFENVVIVGFSVGEGPGVTAPGDIRAFDARTGKEVWRFHTVPRPGQFGHDTWRESSWKERGGANAWGGFSLDTARGIVFAGLGAPAFDFYGGDRKGSNLFANCTIALDARTGKRLWHFQAVRHDLWDYDLPCPPVVVTVRQGGALRDAVAQVTKTGYVFLLDRLTGQSLFDLEERPVPASDTPGEEASPTQIFPRKPPPLSRQHFGKEDITDISDEARADVRRQLEKLRHGPIFTPPSLQGTVVFPGYHGGANWSGASFDPTTGLLYVNTNDEPWITTLKPSESGDSYNHTGYFRFLDPDGYPAVKPPWGHLTAVDLSRGEFTWRVTLGEYPALTARGVPPTGTENFGGTIVTAGGLVFIGGTKDERFRAFDKTSGKVLWEHQLEAGGYATPCTYAVNGRQFVVIAAGGGGKQGTKSGDTFVAFALSEEKGASR